MGADYVLHQAAIPSVQRSVEDPIASNGVNVSGTLNLLVASRDAKVRRFVMASSSSLYGESETLPKVETMAPAPISPYGLQKLAGETYCGIFHRLYGLPAIALRYFNVFGPRQDPTSEYSAVIPLFITAIKREASLRSTATASRPAISATSRTSCRRIFVPVRRGPTRTAVRSTSRAARGSA